MIPYITDKTLAKRSTALNVADDSVHVVATSRHNGKTVQCDWTFSFKNCTPEMRLELMKSSAVIRQQARFEKLPVADVEAACHGVVDVSTLFERARAVPVEPAVAVVSAWSKLTHEQKIAFLRENGIEGMPADDPVVSVTAPSDDAAMPRDDAVAMATDTSAHARRIERKRGAR